MLPIFGGRRSIGGKDMLFAVTEAAARNATPLYHLAGFYEPFAAMSHLLGAALFAVLGMLLLRRGRGSRTRTALLGIYAAACVFQFSMSGLYHMTVRGSDAHRVMGKFDHAAVFLLIAGTFTPVYGLLYRGRLRAGLLAGVWIAAAAGILFTTVFANDAREGMRLALYQALGWSGIVAMIDQWRRHGFVFIWPMLAGSGMTSLAALAQNFGWPILLPGVIHAHETFHVILLIGSIHQWLFIWQISCHGNGSWLNDSGRSLFSRGVYAPHVPLLPSGGATANCPIVVQGRCYNEKQSV